MVPLAVRRLSAQESAHREDTAAREQRTASRAARFVSFTPTHVDPQATAQATGRARFRVRGLYRSPILRDYLVVSLLRHPSVLRVQANLLTGSLLIHFERGAEVTALADAVDSLVAAAVEQRLQQIAAPPPGGALSGPTALRVPALKEEHPWHCLAPDAVLTLCDSRADFGLSAKNAAARLAKYGHNRITSRDEPNPLALFAHQFANLPSGLLAGSAFFSLFTGGLTDAGLIATVVVVNGVIGYVTESRAEHAIRSLDTKEPGTVTVIRGAERCEISSEAIVRGDILLVTTGEVVADARILVSDGLRVDESALTGESQPVRKLAQALTPPARGQTPLAERCNMLFKGTVVTSGCGLAVVVGTGLATELGKIKSLTDEAKTPETILQRNLHQLGDEMVRLSLGVCGAVFVAGLWRGFGLSSMLKTAVSLAIAAVPEGLPTVGTTTLALGLRRLRERHILARSLHGVEAIGTTDVFCFDKTGTLTRNEMGVDVLYLGHERLSAEMLQGSLRRPTDQIPAEAEADLDLLATILTLCNDASLGGEATVASLELLPGQGTAKDNGAGSATEKALLRFAVSMGSDPHLTRQAYPRCKTSYRSEDRQYMRTYHELGPGVATSQGARVWMAAKGNPSQVLALCQAWRVHGQDMPLTPHDRAAIAAQNLSLAHQALRVLGVAYQREAGAPVVWLGLIGLKDPPRQGIKDLIAAFHRAGIRTIMLTGDQMATARALGEDLGLAGSQPLAVAPEDWLRQLDEGEGALPAFGREVHIFPRVSPSSKLKIVRALQQGNGHQVVAMTGDGINDAPALKASDIGISLGQMGTAVAKDCADMVIANDDLAAIYYAILQGRAIRKNLRRSIHFLLATNLSEILVMFGGIVLNLGSPLSPLHLLWINLLTDIFPSLALAMQAPTADLMLEPPEGHANPLFSSHAKTHMAQEAMAITAASLGVFAIVQRGQTGSRRINRLQANGTSASTAAFLSLTLAQLLHALRLHAGEASVAATLFRPSPAGEDATQAGGLVATVGLGIGLLLAGVYAPPLRRILGNAPLSRREGLWSFAGALLPFCMSELDKLLRSEQKGDKKKGAGSEQLPGYSGKVF